MDFIRDLSVYASSYQIYFYLTRDRFGFLLTLSAKLHFTLKLCNRNGAAPATTEAAARPFKIGQRFRNYALA